MNNRYPQYFIEHTDDPKHIWRLNPDGTSNIASQLFIIGWTGSSLDLKNKNGVTNNNLRTISKREARSLFPLAFAKANPTTIH